MPRIKKVAPYQRLAQLPVWISDSAANSTYFNVAQVPDTLSGGKNGFLINGSLSLIRTTDVLIELTDVNGNTVFMQPIKSYNEGLARIVSIEIYDDTPVGPGILTIVGEVARDIDSNLPPSQFQNTYNVRWQKTINIDPTLANTSKIRLYDYPELAVTEQLIPYRATQTGSIVQVMTGSISGRYVPPSVNVVGDNFLTQQRTIVDAGELISADSPIFVRECTGGTFAAIVNTLSYTSSIGQVYSSNAAMLSTPFTASDGSIVAQWTTSDYTMSYQDANTFITSSLNRSYANVELLNLTTFTGDIYRAKFYMKGTDQNQNYQLVEDVVLDEYELTISQSLYGQRISLGQIESQLFLDTNWLGGQILDATSYVTGSLVPTYNADVLLDSAYLSGSTYADVDTTPQRWMGISQSFSMNVNSEYIFAADIVGLNTSDTLSARMDVVVNGGQYSQGIGNALGTTIATFTVNGGQSRKTFLNTMTNFVASYVDEATLTFVVYGGTWYVANARVLSGRDTGFNPDSINALIPITGHRYEYLQFKAELYDANNNLVPVLIETNPVYFDGGNVVIRGPDARLDGILRVAPSGSGPTLSTQGFYNTHGVFVEGQSIFIGPEIPYVFNANTGFFVGTSSFGPEISIGDKLYGYYDTALSEFILEIQGTILVGSGSNFVDIRSLLPRSPKDAVFARITAQAGEFFDLRGDYSVTAGYITDQIARMGNYTREKFPAIWQPPVPSPDIDQSFDAYATSSIVFYSSCSIDLPGGGIGINNNTLYLNGFLTMTAYTASAFFDVSYTAETFSSWAGYPDTSGFGALFAGDDNVAVTHTGSVLESNTINFPVNVPAPRSGNTLYITLKLSVNTEVSV